MRKAAWRLPARAAGILSLVTAFSLLTVSVALAYDPTGQPPGVTEEADTMHKLYIGVTLLALAVFIAVEAALVFMIFRFRKKDDELPPQIHGNNALEILWTAIPMIIVIGLFVASFVVLLDVEKDADDADLTVEITGFQFQWSADYHVNDLGRGESDQDSEEVINITGKAGVEGEPTFIIPVGEPVEFKLASPDVIHSFYVTDFLYKLDVIPGRDNRFTVTAKETGTFDGQCAELCGLNHSLMRFKIKVVAREEFDAWVAEQRAASQSSARQAR